MVQTGLHVPSIQVRHIPYRFKLNRNCNSNCEIRYITTFMAG